MGSRAKADIVLRNVGQLLTLSGHSQKPVSRPTIKSLGILTKEDLCLAGSSGRISFIGSSSDLSDSVVATGAQDVDCKGNMVMPGFVDSHTHAIFAGSRENELSMKLSGESYLEILQSGGGILRTVKDTLEASDEVLIEETANRLRKMTSYGTTTFEVKSGYALNVNGEIRILELLQQLRARQGFDIVTTLLSAHAISNEYGKRNQAYIEDVVIPSINVCAEKHLARFCDVFLEEGVFGYKEAERILSHASKCGMKLKVHADEFSNQNGALLAAKMGAVSADHLGRASLEGIQSLARTGVIAVLLPGTLFSSFAASYAKAREIIESGVPVAIATDMSPNSWVESMQFVIALACYGMRMTPEEAIIGATINGAHAISSASSVGSLELGKAADILVTDVKRCEEIPYKIASNCVSKVIKSGNVIFEN